MENKEFDYHTLDQALEAAEGKVDRRKINSTNPEGFGPETKRVMQEVYDRRAQYSGIPPIFGGGSELLVIERGLEDAASLGDVYVNVAVAHAQEIAYTILAARELEQTGDFSDLGCGICERGVDYIRNIAGCLEGKKSTIGNRIRIILGEKAGEIAVAVMQDLGLTLDEAEKLSEKYDQFEAKTEDQLERLGWTIEPCPMNDYLETLGWEPGEGILPYLEQAEKLEHDREWFEEKQMEQRESYSVDGIVEGINKSPLQDDTKRDAIAAVRASSEQLNLLFEHGKHKPPENNYEGVVVWHSMGSVMETLTPVFEKHDVAPPQGRDTLRYVYRAIGGRGPVDFEVQESGDVGE